MNVQLRKITSNDIELIRQWRNSELIQSVSYNRDYITPEMQSKWFESIKDNLNQFHWIINVDGVDAGYAAIKNIDLKNKRCEFASLYIADEKFLFNGSGAIAQYKILNYIFSEYSEILKVYCEVLGFNKKVIQLHKRFGFLIEGEQRNQYFLNDKFENVILLALFKNEWETYEPILKKILVR